MRKKNSNKMEAICSVAGLLFTACIFAACLHDGEPTPAAEEDNETGRIVWSEAPAVVEEPTEAIKIVFDADGIPTATAAAEPTDTVRASFEETCTNTPTPTPVAQYIRISWHLVRINEAEREKNPTPTPTPTPAAEWRPVDITAGVPGTYKTPADGSHRWKPWAWYTAITATNSPQYRLQQMAATDENGLRVVEDPAGVARFCIAMEPTWAGGTSNDIGRCIDIVMESGAVLPCVLADLKKIEHSQNRAGVYGRNGELMEFLADGAKLNPAAKRSGTVSSIGGAFAEEATEVRVLEMFIAGFGG